MDIVLFLMSIPLVCFGVYLCGDFLIWKYRAEVLEGEVMGFQKAKSKGRLLPVMRILGDKNKIETIKVVRIDALSCLLLPLQKGEVRDIAVRDGKAIVPGYVQLVPGIFLMVPFVITCAFMLGSSLWAARFIYLFIAMVIMGGGWLALIFIRQTQP